MVEVIFADGSKREVVEGTLAADLVAELPEEIRRAVVAARVNGRVLDLRQRMSEGGAFEPVTIADEEALDTLSNLLGFPLR